MFRQILCSLLVITAMLVSVPALAASVNLGSAISLNPGNPLDCAILWQATGGDTLFGQSSPVAGSSTNHITVSPVDVNYADKIKVDATVVLNSNLKDVRAAADIDTDIKVKNIYEPNSPTQNLDVNLNSILDTTGAYFKFNRFNISGVNTNGATNDWYVQNFNLNNDQITATKDIVSIFAEILSTPKSQVYSNNSEARMQQMMCKLVDRVDVSPSQSITVGSGAYAQTKQVRVASITINPNYEQILAQEFPEVLQVLLNDSTFTSFLKNQHSRFVRFIKDVDVLSSRNTPSTIPTQDMYNSAVDSLKGMYKKDDLAKAMSESFAKNREMSKQEIEENKYLIDANSGEIYGMISQIKTTFSDKYISDISSDKITGDILRSGIRTRFESYDYKTSTQVSNIVLPSNTKPASSFNDLMNANNQSKPSETESVISRASKLRSKLISCEGKTGKLLNSKGQIIKKTPRGSNLIYADRTGLALTGDKDTISCVKSATKYGALTCSGNIDKRLNYKGAQAGRPSEKGTVLYMSDDFGKLFTTKFNTVICTQDSTLLGI